MECAGHLGLRCHGDGSSGALPNLPFMMWFLPQFLGNPGAYPFQAGGGVKVWILIGTHPTCPQSAAQVHGPVLKPLLIKPQNCLQFPTEKLIMSLDAVSEHSIQLLAPVAFSVSNFSFCYSSSELCMGPAWTLLGQPRIQYEHTPSPHSLLKSG